MKTGQGFLGFIFLFVGFITVQAEEKKETLDPAKMIGKWEPVKKAGFLIEVMKDNKLQITTTDAEGKKHVMPGTYKWANGKFEVNVKTPDGDKPHVVTVKVLTDDKLVTVDEANKEEEFKKVK